jgi:hypothetical protein
MTPVPLDSQHRLAGERGDSGCPPAGELAEGKARCANVREILQRRQKNDVVTSRGRLGSTSQGGDTLMALWHTEAAFTRRCERLIDDLTIRYPFELTAFLKRLGEERGKPLTLWRMNPNNSLPTGMLVDTHDEGCLFVVRDISPSFLRHIAFHEVGHMLLETVCHSSPDAPAPANAESDQEKQAERFAYLLTAHVSAGDRRHCNTRATGAQLQLRSAFGSRRQLCSGRA